MKLLYCLFCQDIIRLRFNEEKECYCGETRGKYIDKLNAVYSGAGIPLGIQNSSFLTAVEGNMEYGEGYNFAAFTIGKDCQTFRREDDAIGDAKAVDNPDLDGE